jgi:hypothetical protein
MIMAAANCHPPETAHICPEALNDPCSSPDREDIAAGVDELGPEQVSQERCD